MSLAEGSFSEGLTTDQYAHWWKRVLARLIDGMVVGLPMALLMIPFIVVLAGSAEVDPATGELESLGTSGLYTTLFVFVILLATIAPIVYEVVLNGNDRGQTVGKMVMKICVRDSRNGGRIGYARAFLRYVVQSVLWIACYIPGIVDLLFPLWDEKRQTIHDKAANSVVIDLDAAPPPIPQAQIGRTGF